MIKTLAISLIAMWLLSFIGLWFEKLRYFTTLLAVGFPIFTCITMEFTRSKKIVCPECKGVRYNHHSNNGMCMTCNGEGVI
jgi:hypothetical protein